MATRVFYASLEFDNDGHPGMPLPDEKKVVAALRHSTASEALSEAACMGVTICLFDQDQTRLVNVAEELLGAAVLVEELLKSHNWGEGPARRALQAAIAKAKP